MLNEEQLLSFKKWIASNTTYSKPVISDIACRLSRANKLHPITESDDLEFYLYRLGTLDEFKALSMSVRSQLRKSIKLFKEYKAST